MRLDELILADRPTRIRLGSFSQFVKQFRVGSDFTPTGSQLTSRDIVGIHAGPRPLYRSGYTHCRKSVLLLTKAAHWLERVGLLSVYKAAISPFCSMDLIIDSVVLFTVENGILTWYVLNRIPSTRAYMKFSMATIAALVCVSVAALHGHGRARADVHRQWLTMPHNLVFMGLHFAISKRQHSFRCVCSRLPRLIVTFAVYANSLLASWVQSFPMVLLADCRTVRLNTRKSLRRTQAAIVDGAERNEEHISVYPVPGSPIALSCLSGVRVIDMHADPN